MVEKSEGSGAGSSLRSKTIEKAAGRLYIQYGSTPPVPRTAVFALSGRMNPGLGDWDQASLEQDLGGAFIRNCMFSRRIIEQDV